MTALKRRYMYLNYQIAAKSQDLIYALEYGEMCFRNGELKAEVENARGKEPGD